MFFFIYNFILLLFILRQNLPKNWLPILQLPFLIDTKNQENCAIKVIL